MPVYTGPSCGRFVLGVMTAGPGKGIMSLVVPKPRRNGTYRLTGRFVPCLYRIFIQLYVTSNPMVPSIMAVSLALRTNRSAGYSIVYYLSTSSRSDACRLPPVRISTAKPNTRNVLRFFMNRLLLFVVSVICLRQRKAHR